MACPCNIHAISGHDTNKLLDKEQAGNHQNLTFFNITVFPDFFFFLIFFCQAPIIKYGSPDTYHHQDNIDNFESCLEEQLS